MKRLFDWPWRSSAQIRRDIDAELAHHVELVEEECRAAGMSAEEARAEVARRLGELSVARRAMIKDDRRYEARNRFRFAGRSLAEDVRFAARTFADRPVFSALTLGTLAAGITTATVFFGAVHSILVSPLALDAPDRVVSLWGTEPEAGVERDGLAPATIFDIGERSRTLEAVAGAQPHSHDVMAAQGPMAVNSWYVSEEFFDVLRATPAAGRLLGPADFTSAGERTFVITHRYWASQFGADPSAIGRTLDLDGTPHTLVGVVPADFPVSARDLFVPRRPGAQLWESRFAAFFAAFGRLRPGVSIQTARSELREIAGQLALEYPEANAGKNLDLAGLRSDIVGGVSQGLWLLLAAAVLILLVSCINGAGLLLAQATTRTRELAIRAAIGAGQGRLTRQLVTETSLLVGIAAIVAMPAAAAGIGLFRRASPPGMPRIEEVVPDFRIAVIASMVAFGVALLVGLVPAIRVAQPDLYEVLKPGGRSGTLTPAASRVRSGLVGAEVAIAVVLLVGGGLLQRSWERLGDADQGYRVEDIYAAEVHYWQFHEDDDAAARAEFARLVTDRLTTTPGVTASAVTTSLPLVEQIGNEDGELLLPGSNSPSAVRWLAVDPGYFDALGVTTLAGRVFESHDGPDTERVAVVSAEAARRLWASDDPLGQTVMIGSSDDGPAAARIVGIVKDVRYSGLESNPEPTVYVPHTQAGAGSVYFLVRTDGASGHEILRNVLADLQPSLVLAGEPSLSEATSRARQPRRFSLLLLTVFGAVALVLTVVGLFGHLSHSIRSREHELGVRMALGAWPGRLVKMIMRQGLALVALGAATGLSLAFVLSRFMSALLYEIAPLDPPTFVSAALLVLAVGAAASYWPARRVSRVDPVAALRAE